MRLLLRGDTGAVAAEDFASPGVFAAGGDCDGAARRKMDALPDCDASECGGGQGIERDAAMVAGGARDAGGSHEAGAGVLQSGKVRVAARGSGADGGGIELWRRAPRKMKRRKQQQSKSKSRVKAPTLAAQKARGGRWGTKIITDHHDVLQSGKVRVAARAPVPTAVG